MTLERILSVVEKAKTFPNPTIEYNGELPEHPEITEDSFFGIKAIENKNVSINTGCLFTYKIS
jgi:hypothetical protein